MGIRYDCLHRVSLPPAELTGVRAPDPTDSDALQELFIEAFANTIDQEGRENLLRPYSQGVYGQPLWDRSFICEGATRILGAALVTDYSRAAHIAFLAVRSDHRRLGIATDLVTRILTSCRWQACTYVTRGNEASERFFAKLGFRRTWREADLDYKKD